MEQTHIITLKLLLPRGKLEINSRFMLTYLFIYFICFLPPSLPSIHLFIHYLTVYQLWPS